MPIGFAAAVASARLLPESHGPARRLDLPALALIAGASLAVTWGLVRAGGSGWGDGSTAALLAGGVALLAGFVLRERTAAEPMVPLRLLRSRTFSAANAAAFLHSGAIFSAAFLTTEYFQLGLGYGPLATGLRLLLWTATPMIVASLATGGPKSLINWLTDAVGNPIRDLGRYRDEWQRSFHFTFVEPADFTPTERAVWDASPVSSCQRGQARAHQGRACFRDHAPDGRPLPGGGRSLGRGGRPDHRQAHPTPVARCVRRHRAARAIACPQWCTRRKLRVRAAAD